MKRIEYVKEAIVFVVLVTFCIAAAYYAVPAPM